MAAPGAEEGQRSWESSASANVGPTGSHPSGRAPWRGMAIAPHSKSSYPRCVGDQVITLPLATTLTSLCPLKAHLIAGNLGYSITAYRLWYFWSKTPEYAAKLKW